MLSELQNETPDSLSIVVQAGREFNGKLKAQDRAHNSSIPEIKRRIKTLETPPAQKKEAAIKAKESKNTEKIKPVKSK